MQVILQEILDNFNLNIELVLGVGDQDNCITDSHNHRYLNSTSNIVSEVNGSGTPDTGNVFTGWRNLSKLKVIETFLFVQCLATVLMDESNSNIEPIEVNHNSGNSLWKLIKNREIKHSLRFRRQSTWWCICWETAEKNHKQIICPLVEGEKENLETYHPEWIIEIPTISSWRGPSDENDWN